MSVEIIRTTADGSIGFGDYTLTEKTKVVDFPFQGDLYKVKTFTEITKLKRNGSLVYESMPGTKVENFKAEERKVSFVVEGMANTQITLDLEAEQEYRVVVDDTILGNMKTNIGGKLIISVDLTGGNSQKVVIEKI